MRSSKFHFTHGQIELVREGIHDLRREGVVIAEQRAQAPEMGQAKLG